MASFYTGGGDQGDTGYLGAGRISKDSLRIEAVGTVDEVTAALGLARSIAASEKTCTILVQIQKQLYGLMTELSASLENAKIFSRISEIEVNWLEEQIRELEKLVILPREFILPGETPASGALSLARTITRRAERRVVSLFDAGELPNKMLMAYLNRLSSLLFILEVYESSQSGGTIRLAKGG